ncbi:hypothetical protein [Clostridium hydrogeniformans]|nr:hypothetical protein [Clostridium hydrogeniformans]
MSKNKFSQNAKNQSMIDNSNDSANSKNGFKSSGNSALSENARNTKGKK